MRKDKEKLEDKSDKIYIIRKYFKLNDGTISHEDYKTDTGKKEDMVVSGGGTVLEFKTIDDAKSWLREDYLQRSMRNIGRLQNNVLVKILEIVDGVPTGNDIIIWKKN